PAHRRRRACPLSDLWSVPMPRRALVADDDPLTRELIASMLEELGCETLTARSAALPAIPNPKLRVPSIRRRGQLRTYMAKAPMSLDRLQALSTHGCATRMKLNLIRQL